jgi:type I restriction enzyme S subunit
MKWEKKQLREVADFSLGKMLDQKKNKGNLLPYLANINVRWGEFSFDDIREMRFEDDELERYGLRLGDILMCEGGEPGRCALWKNHRPGMMFQKALHRIRPHQCLNPYYLYYFFLYFGKTGQFSRLFTGSTINHLPREKLALVEVDVPTLPTQRKIASILSAYDNLIENNTRRIAILEEMAQRIYKEWFVNFRFPGHENAKYVDSPLGKIPEGWAIRPFTDIAEILSGGTPKTSNDSYWNGSIPFFTPKDCPEAFFVLNTERRITTEGLANCASSLFPPRTVFITARGTVGKTVLTPEPMAMSQSCYAVAGKEYPQSFILMTLRRYIEELKKKSHGAVFDTIIKDTFIQLKVLCPTTSVVNHFCNTTLPFFDQILVLSKKQQVLRATRDLLLPKLISGRLDVEDLDIDTLEPLVDDQT